MMFIKITPIPPDKYRLVESIIIEGVKIDAGFEWDGASIPRLLWEEIGPPFAPSVMAASMVHDYLYGHGKKSGYTRKQADKLFKKLLLANGCAEETAETMYIGVRIGGESHWHA